VEWGNARFEEVAEAVVLPVKIWLAAKFALMIKSTQRKDKLAIERLIDMWEMEGN